MIPNAEINPVARMVYDTYHKSISKDLEKSYFQEFGHANKWLCLSDYAFDDRKANHVITFSFFPHVMDMSVLSFLIKQIAPKDIKNTRNPNPNFIRFIKNAPFLNFSFILTNYKHVFYNDRALMIDSMIGSLEAINTSINKTNFKNANSKKYYARITEKVVLVKGLLSRGKKVQLISKLFLITSIGSTVAAQIANRTNTQILGWFSDRDAINDIAENFSNELFHMLFSEHLTNKDCQFIATPSSSKDEKWYKEMIRVPDYITGTLADYNYEINDISHEKFKIPVLDLIVGNNRNVFVMKLDFNNKGVFTCSRINHIKTN